MESNAFKEGIDENAVRRIARCIRSVAPEFPNQKFINIAARGLVELELKARVAHVIAALRICLPGDPIEAIGILVETGSRLDPGDENDPLRWFAAWPLIDFVAEHGIDHFDVSIDALRCFTEQGGAMFSAEFAIRPFIDRYPKKTLSILRSWTADPSEHIRRLVSEGTRPRLPWGSRLRKLQEDPKPVLALLERLKDDSSLYVRRSVANNLNDIAKDHPDTVIDVCARWSKGASKERQWIIRHATRTLIKQGHPGALKIQGFDPHARVGVRKLKLSKKQVRLGDDLVFSFELASTAKHEQQLVVDYKVHHVKANGTRSAKVFKLRVVDLKGRDVTTLQKTYKFRRITTRQYYSGRHTIEILVNGRTLMQMDFTLRL